MKIKTYENEIIHFTPSIPRYCEISNIFIIPNPVNHMKMLKQVDSSKYIYKLSGFSDNLLNELENNLGGKMRCKYVERDLDGKIVGSKIGIVDVKGYKGKEKIYGYFEFEMK